MIQKLLLLSLLVFTLNAASDTKQKVTIGAGPFIQTQAYKGADNIFIPSPVIFFDNSLFYIRWSRAGVYFLGDKSEKFSWGVSLTAQPRTYGYEASDSTYLQGMDKRDNTLKGGLAFSAQYDDAYIEVMALTDIFHRNYSFIFKTEIGDKYTLGKLIFYPSIIISYQSADFINYYYGVKNSESTAWRAEYKADAGIQLGAQTYIKYPFNDNWAVLLNARVDKIPTEASNSPIVDKDYIYSGLLSLIYTFEY